MNADTSGSAPNLAEQIANLMLQKQQQQVQSSQTDTMERLCGDMLQLKKAVTEMSQQNRESGSNVSAYNASFASGSNSTQQAGNGKGYACYATRLDERIVPKESVPADDLMIVDSCINDLKVRVLIDTGANRTVVSNDLVEELGLQIQPLQQKMGAEGIGGRIEFIGFVHFRLTLGNCTRKISSFVAKHNDVFRKASFLALISYKTLAEFPSILINPAARCMSIEGQVIPVGDISVSSCHYLRVDNKCTLKPNLQTKVQVYLDSKSKQKCDGFHVENIPNVEHKYGFSVTPAVLDATGKAFVFIANNTQKEIELLPGTCVAKAAKIQITSDPTVVQYMDENPESESHLGYLRVFHLTG